MTRSPAGGNPAARSDGGERILEGLNDLLQLDHDAMGAYEIAIEHLQDRHQALKIEGFKREHELHIRSLNDLIQKLGGAPANEPHATGPLKQAIQRMGALGGDRALLLAWRANEFQLMRKYGAYARKASAWAPEIRALINAHTSDEERHYRWVVNVLGEDKDENELGRRVRERVAQVQQLKVEAQARLSRGLSTASSYLREARADGLRATVEREIRARPKRSLLVFAAVGFCMGRLLR